MGLTWAPWVSVSEGSSTPGGSVTAVPWGNLLALFIADPIGGIFTASGNAEQGWGDGWSSVAEGSTMPGAPVTAVALPNGRFALFIADPVGAIYYASGNTQQGWGSGWSLVADNDHTEKGGPVSAVALANGRVALFMADYHGVV